MIDVNAIMLFIDSLYWLANGAMIILAASIFIFLIGMLWH